LQGIFDAVRGTKDLQAYLGQLMWRCHRLAWSVFIAVKICECVDVDAEFSGVNKWRSPVCRLRGDAVCIIDRRIRRVTAVVQRVSDGHALLIDPKQDPCGYFKGSLMVPRAATSQTSERCLGHK
jgi:hypothetical protein